MGICLNSNALKKAVFTCLLLQIGIINSFGQAPTPTGKKFISAEYDRCGITYIFLEKGNSPREEKLKNVFKAKNTIPPKYYDNRISDPVLGGTVSDFGPKTSKEKLLSSKVPNKVMDILFGGKGDVWHLDTLIKRGQYNMTDDQVLLLKGSAKGFTAGSENAIFSEKIIKKSFIITFGIDNIQSMTEIYDQQDRVAKEQADRSKGKIAFTPVDRVMKGYKANLIANCYLIDINDSLMNQVWNSYGSKAERDSIVYPLRLVLTNNFSIKNVVPVKAPAIFGKLAPAAANANSQNKANTVPEETFLEGLANAIDLKMLAKLEEDISDFKVRAPLVNNKPIAAKIGLKEGVGLDQRFYVYENVMNRKGEAVSVRRGVIRASKAIVDNRNIATGTTATTEFYQVGGRKLDPGMLIQQMPDKGISVFVGSFLPTSKNRNVFNVRLSMNLSQYSNKDGKGKMPSQVRLIADFDVYSVAKTGDGFDGSTSNALTAIGGGLGIQRDKYLGPHFQFSPFATINYNSVSYSDTTLEKAAKFVMGEDWGRVISLKAGADLGANLSHKLKLVVSGFINTLSKKPKWGSGYSEDETNRMRMGLMVNVKLRYDL